MKYEIIEFSTLSVNDLSALPEYWNKVFSKDDFAARKVVLLAHWKNFSQQASATTQFIENHLIDLSLVRDQNDFAMLYTLTNELGKPVRYLGRNPKNLKMSKPLAAVWESLPVLVRDFYSQLHNGWFHLSSHSGGYLSTEEIIFLGDLEWGFLDDVDEKNLPFQLQNCVALFHNGGGSYVAYDLKSTDSSQGFIWWKDSMPDLNEQLLPLIDEWTVTSLES